MMRVLLWLDMSSLGQLVLLQVNLRIVIRELAETGTRQGQLVGKLT